MGFTITDPLIGPSRGTRAQAVAYASRRGAKRPEDVTRYVDELWRLCDVAHLDAALAFAQACDETDTFKSDYWVRYANPAGIGALETLDAPGQIDYVGGSYSAETAAHAHVVHLYVYAVGPVPAGHPLAPFVPLDPRYDAVIAAGFAGRATALSYLSGRWAANPGYAKQIVAHATAAFGNGVVATPTGTPTKETAAVTTTPATNNLDVPPADYVPVQYSLATDYARFGLTQWQATYLLGQCSPRLAEIEGVIIHAQFGYTPGSLMHWLSVQASATALVQRDGSVLWVIPDAKRQWTTGDVLNPTERSRVLYRGGLLPDHRAVAFEFEALRGQDFTREQVRTFVWLMRRYRSRYPSIALDEEHITGHATFNTGEEKSACPGQQNLDRCRQAAFDDAATTGTVTMPEPTAPVVAAVVERKELAFLTAIPQTMAGFGYATEDVGDTTFYPFPRRWAVVRDTPVYQYGTVGSAQITDGSGAALTVRKGAQIDGAYVFRSPQDGDWWLVSTTAGRVPLSAVDNPYPFLQSAANAA